MAEAATTPERRPLLRPLRSLRQQHTVHREQHSEHGDVTRDIIIGFADGLTVPFALTAGLSSYVLTLHGHGGHYPTRLLVD